VPAVVAARPVGIPHRSAATGDDRTDAGAEAVIDLVGPVVERGTVSFSALRRVPLVRTRSVGPSKVTSTVPSVSVRYVSPAAECSRSIVDGAGCP
jgi:hypothetical protein